MKKCQLRALNAIGALILIVLALLGDNYLRHLVYWLPTEEATFVSGDGGELMDAMREFYSGWTVR